MPVHNVKLKGTDIRMLYKSTRENGNASYSSAEVIKIGLADDGGLFIPERIPKISTGEINELCGMNYPRRASYILSKFLTDYSADELLTDSTEAYSEESFPGGAAPLVRVGEGDSNLPPLYSLELWHGPTAAFKDMALQIMPRLLSRALEKTGEKRTAMILVATSGDTGKAALEGYRDVPKTRITVFYPLDGVSRVQGLQMSTQTGGNVDVCAIRGNFDDAQNGVKQIFSDPDMAKLLDRYGYFFSSANSINWGRLAPQIVYYISAYCDLLESGAIKNGDEINVCVPTGNFGNILAAYIAKLMGLPLGKLICASNSNNVLTDFLSTGTYDRNRHFHVTMSPSMDILISSNLERLLAFTAGSDCTRNYMEQLAATGKYTVSADILKNIKESFVGFYADEKETAAAVRRYFEKYSYLSDTHTAVALACAEKYREVSGDSRIIVAASTASPYKFAGDVYRSLTGRSASGDLEALDELHALTGAAIPRPLYGIGERTIRFSVAVSKEDMKDYVKRSFI